MVIRWISPGRKEILDRLPAIDVEVPHPARAQFPHDLRRSAGHRLDPVRQLLRDLERAAGEDDHRLRSVRPLAERPDHVVRVAAHDQRVDRPEERLEAVILARVAAGHFKPVDPAVFAR